MEAKHINGILTPTDVNTMRVPGSVRVSLIRQIYDQILYLWIYLSNLGVSEGQKASSIKKIRLTNKFAAFGIITCTVELPIYFYLGASTSVTLIILIDIFLFGVLILNRYFLSNLAKALIFIIIDLVLIYSTGYLGKESGLYLSFYSVVILPFILFDFSEKIKITTFTLIALASVYIVVYVDLSVFSDPAITPEIKKTVFQSSVLSSFISVLFCVFSLVKENAISEKSLGESESLFKGILEATPDSTVLTDNEGIITLCNKQVEAVFGYAENELLGKHITTLIPKRFRDQSESYFKGHKSGLQNNTKTGTDDLFFVQKDGVEIPVEISLNTYLAKSGKMMIMVIRDVTERKKYEQELIQFSYVVSHDLKAPLRAIFKLSEWIEEDLGRGISPDLQKHLQLLRGRVFRLEALINGLLEYSKIGRLNVKKETVNTQAMIGEVIDLLAPPTHIEVRVQPGMPIFETAKIPLQQIFFNLLSNAIKYNDKEKGVISISVIKKGKFYEFSVEDNGMGIDPAYHEKVFVIFQTLEARDKVEGTGIGLTVVKKSVEDAGGKVSLSSEQGKGARFTFTWPE